jgi:predicted amidohydrolase YtcJ
MNTQKTHNRRRFLKGGAALAGLTAAPWSRALAQSDPSHADLVIHNAKVYTVEDRMPRAEAFAVRDGRFIAVGSSEDIKALAGPRTATLDAQQATIVPGFIDCHNHAIGEQLVYDVIVGNPYAVEFFTIQSILDKLKARAQTTPPGFWVEGFLFDDVKIKDKRPLTRLDLDKVSTEHPVAVHHRGGHTSFYNSKALALAGVTRDTQSRAEGTYDKDANGELTGRVTDRARSVFAKVGQRPTYSAAEQAIRSRNGHAFMSKKFVEYGLTGVHHQNGDLAGLQDIYRSGDLLHRCSYETSGKMLDAMIANGIQSGMGDEWLRFGATSEHTIDGSLSERTMSRSTPYPGTNYKGNLTEPQEVLDAWVDKVRRAGIQINVHANGDVAIDMTLTAVEKSLKSFPAKDDRVKITHCSLINDDLVRRIKAVGAVPAPFTSYMYFNAEKFDFYGEEMLSRMMAFRTFIDNGIIACAGSDFRAGIFSPLMGIQGMVTRTGWNGKTWGANQRVTVAEALKINTLNGAYATHEEGIKGSITPGKLADYVMLADDIHTIDPNRIKDVKILRTVTGGRTVYTG